MVGVKDFVNSSEFLIVAKGKLIGYETSDDGYYTLRYAIIETKKNDISVYTLGTLFTKAKDDSNKEEFEEDLDHPSYFGFPIKESYDKPTDFMMKYVS